MWCRCCLKITAAVLAYIQHILFSPLSPMCLCAFSSCSVFDSASLLYLSLLWSHFGSVSERCSRRGSSSSSQHRAHYLAERTSRPSQCDWDCAQPGLPLVIFAKSLSSQSGRFETLRALFAEYLAFFSFYPPLIFSVSVSVATSGTSSLAEEVFSTALQSNGNDCAPGETENCICVLEWCTVMRLSGKHAQK